MKPLYHEILNAVEKKVSAQKVPMADRKGVTEATLAQCLAYLCPIPPVKVEDPNLHFTTKIKFSVLPILSFVNEKYVIDIPRATELVYKFWLARYCLVHAPGRVTGFRMDQLLLNSHMVSEKQRDTLSRYCTNLSGYKITDMGHITTASEGHAEEDN